MNIEVKWQNWGTLVGIDGVWKSFEDWSDYLGLSRSAVRNRLRNGWTIEEALELCERHAVRLERPERSYRHVTDKEKKKRGCIYCMDTLTTGSKQSTYYVGRFCPHLRCPYHELDKYDDYGDYMKATDLNGFVKALEAFGLTVEEEEDL